jgi:hypothetical protein
VKSKLLPIHLKQEMKITIKEFMNVDRLTAETIMSLSIVIVLCVLYTSIFLNYSSLDFTIILIHVLGNLLFSYKNLEFITISCFTCVLFTVWLGCIKLTFHSSISFIFILNVILETCRVH